MQWELRIEGNLEAKPARMIVHDGATPPLIGESFHIAPNADSASKHLLGYSGYYTVVERDFLVELVTDSGECTYAWSLVLRRKAI